MNEIIKEIRKLAKRFDKESKKRKIDVQSEKYEMGIIRDIIKEEILKKLIKLVTLAIFLYIKLAKVRIILLIYHKLMVQ